MKVHINRGCLILIALFLSAIYTPAICQETVEARFDRLEAKLDSLLALLRTRVERVPAYETISDTLNLVYGIVSAHGTILNKKYFVINHNDDWKIPYWVAYYLSLSNLQGDATRMDNFRPDRELSIGSRAELEDYRNSGYDRGHNAPAAAFKRSREAMSTTFLLSNMSPQTFRLNRYIWKELEDDVRELVRAKGEAWVVTGNLSLSADSQCICPRDFIGPGEEKNVVVPTHCYKVILAREENETFSAYAFLMPNQLQQIPSGPEDYMITIDRLEEITGYDFFPLLPDSTENDIEDEVLSWSW
jgi:endonuclease G